MKFFLFKFKQRKQKIDILSLVAYDGRHSLMHEITDPA